LPLATLSDPAAIVLAAIGALLVLGGIAHGVAHWLGLDPRWAREARHDLAEAGWRVGSLWSEFVDWLRLGR
jgi:hypothetical protein